MVVAEREERRRLPNRRQGRVSGLPVKVALLALVVVLLQGGELAAASQRACDLADQVLRARELSQQGELEKAEELARDLLPRAEDECGEGHLLVADVLELLVDIVNRTRAPRQEDVDRIRRSAAIRGDAQPPDKEGQARALVILGAVLSDDPSSPEAFDDAERAYEAAIELQREVHGADSLIEVDTITYLVELYEDRGDSGPDFGDEKNDPVLLAAEKAVRIGRRASLEGDSAELAEALNTRGKMFHNRGLLEKARADYFECLDMRLRVLPPGHGQIARAWHNRGVIQRDLGDLEAARVDLEEALRIRRQIAGDRYPGIVASSLHELGRLDYLIGDIPSAVERYLEALPRMIAGYGELHPYPARVHRDLAEAYLALNDISSAVRHQTEALGILEASAPGTPLELRARSGLGALKLESGEREEGRSLLESALLGQRGLAQPHLADLASTLRALAVEALGRGRTDSAAAHLTEAVAVVSQLGSGDHPELLPALMELAELRLRTSDHRRAVDALDLAERALDRSPVDRSLVRQRLYELRASAEWAASGGRPGRRQRALELAHRAVELESGTWGSYSRAFSFSRALLARAAGSSGLDLLLSGLDARSSPEEVRAAWAAMAARRGLVLGEQELRYAVARRSDDAEVQKLYRRVLNERRLLAKMQLRGRSVLDQQSRDVKTLMEQSAARLADFEAELGDALRRSSDVSPGQRVASPDELARSIQRPAGVVSFVRFRRLEPGQLEGVEHYGRFVLAGTGASSFADLGPVAAIDQTIGAYRQAVSGYWLEARESTREVERLGLQLSRLLLAPIDAIRSSDRLYLVPEGAIHLLNLAALPSPEGGFLLESLPPIEVLGTERDLLPSELGVASVTTAAQPKFVVVGGPDFGPAPRSTPATEERSLLAAAWNGLTQSVKGAVEAFFRGPCRDGQPFFVRLPGARREAEWLESFVSEGEAETAFIAAVGEAASERWLKRQAQGATSIHIASHAFFDLSCRQRERATVPVPVDEAMLPSAGIALAGANLRAAEGMDGEDGILMASEIAALDLSNVEQLVLSACETAVGTPSEGEGLFGLTRSFRLAGVRSQIVTLWPVEDRATLAWMKEFYRARASGEDAAEAVRSASMALASSPDGRSSHPATWAAFVALGRGGAHRDKTDK